MADTSRTDIGGIAQTFHGTETFNYDALANQVSMSRVTSNSVWPGNVAGSTSGEQFAYASDSTGRLRKRFSNDESDSLRYNQAGDLEFEYDTQGGMRTSHDRAQFYGADGTLRAVDDRTASALQNNVYTGNAFYTFEEYRYDAFGRRVAMRSQRYCDMGRFEHRLPCLVSVVRRTVWDGDMELDEVQMPGGDASTTAPAATDVVMERDSGSVALVVVDSGGAIPNDPNPFFGRVAYSYGLTLDQPVAVNRYGYLENAAAGDSAHHFAPYTLSPFWSWRGVVEVGLFNDGGAVPYDVTGATSRLARRIYWPYSVTAYHRQFLDQTSWQGSLMDDKQDGTGLAYRRNRYLDPSSGRFTQEDPAGVGGGLNAYGFAGGDPVTYSDPFGLCPKDGGGDGKTEAYADCPKGSSGYYANQDAEGKGGIKNTAHGVAASCFENTTCRVGAHIGVGIAGGWIAEAAMEALPVGEALDAAVSFLGEGYREVGAATGRFMSSDGMRVVRMGVKDILGKHGGGPHINLERLVPNPAKPGKPMPSNPFHLYIKE